MTYPAVTRFATKEPTVCAVCRRRAVWLGYAPKQGGPIMWLCDHKHCHEVSRKVYKMPGEYLDAYEVGAADEAFNAAGAYLVEIGTTDLSHLTEPQIGELNRRYVRAYEDALRRKILSGEAPF